MKLKIAWLYYDLLELYGDRGNIKVLEKILTDNNIAYCVDQITINDTTDISDHDIIFLGGGSDNAQNIIYPDLLKRRDQIIAAMAKNAFILTICGGYQMFGQYYINSHQQRVEGLNIFDYYTVGSDLRCIGNVVCEADLAGEKVTLVGFENHGGQTIGVMDPLAKIIKGNGNEYQSQYEGMFKDNFIGTYLHGSLLPKNPEIGKYMIEYVLRHKYNDERDIKIDGINFYQQAKQIIIKREK